MEKLNLDKNNLKKFGITMGIVFLVIMLIILIRHRHSILPAALVSGIFFLLALVAPVILKPIYILWMRLAFILSWINTRVILTLIFYLIFTPVGLVLRLFRIDPLDRKIEKNKNSYWKKKEERELSPLNYERQF